MQHMKGIRCLEIVSNPAFLEHSFSLFDSSPSQGPLGVELIHFEPRACILITLSSASMNNDNVSPHFFYLFKHEISNGCEMAVNF